MEICIHKFLFNPIFLFDRFFPSSHPLGNQKRVTFFTIILMLRTVFVLSFQHNFFCVYFSIFIVARNLNHSSGYSRPQKRYNFFKLQLSCITDIEVYCFSLTAKTTKLANFFYRVFIKTSVQKNIFLVCFDMNKSLVLQHLSALRK